MSLVGGSELLGFGGQMHSVKSALMLIGHRHMLWKIDKLKSASPVIGIKAT